jgi:tetratricopeptide (TPR) repeat protein
MLTWWRRSAQRYHLFKGAMDQVEAAGMNTPAVFIGANWRRAFPHLLGPAMRLGEAQRRVGNVEGALETIEAALTQRPDNAFLLKRASKLCRLLGEHERAIEYLFRISTQDADETRQMMLEVAEMRLALVDAIGARDALEAAYDAGEPRQNQRALEAQIAYLRRDRAGGLALIEQETAERAPSEEIERIRAKLLMLPAVRTQKRAVRLHSAATSELRAYADAANLPTAAHDTEAMRLITPAGDILIERSAGARALLIAFGGLATMFGAASDEMSSLVCNKSVNTMFVSDPQRLFMLGGFASVGDYRTTIAWLHALRTAWAFEHFYCIGFSGGGYPALRYGLDLGARRILTFAAPTQITPGITKIDTRATALAIRTLNRKPDMCVNMRDEIAKLGATAPEIINYYGADMPEDAYHGRNIEGLPTVSSHPVSGLNSHAVIAWLKQSGKFNTILHEFLREVTPLRSVWTA